MFVIISSLSIAISLISMGYVIAQERTKLLKSFQVTNGLRTCEYWVGKMLTDLSKLLILLFVLVIVHTILDVCITYYPIILVGSYFSCLAFFYYLNSFSQRLFAFSFLTLLVHCIIVIPGAVIVTMIKLSVILQEENSTTWNIIDTIARIIPIYNLTSTLVSSVFNSLMIYEGHRFFSSSLTWHFLSIWILFSSLSFVFYFTLLILTDDSMSACNLNKAYNFYFKYSDIPTMKDNNEETLIHSGKDFDLIKAAQYLSLPSNADTVALVDAELVDFKDELKQNREVADIGKF
jgi:hypothetical protein